MKHARKDYNRIQDPAGLIPDNEPVFLVRGQDKVGWIVCVVWAILHFITTGNKRMTLMALMHGANMMTWARKDADAPEEAYIDLPLAAGEEAR